MTSEVVFIGGRSGTGKTSTGFEMHAMLSIAGVAHCLIDGDFLDMAYPAPSEHQLAEQNLAAMWANYRAVGHRRLIYTNTACVLPDVVHDLTTAMGDNPEVRTVLLTCTDATARARLGRREIGSTLDQHIASSARMDTSLRTGVAPGTHRIPTDNRTVSDIAEEIIGLTGWSAATP
ncbi:ATPase [Mycolicibacterium nivoides]|uniref:ATPase n=1 Tax=Mycolicibacterium nivoides TaxID=2487344 RepID=UPI003C30D25F